jgi:hypothetical protein
LSEAVSPFFQTCWGTGGCPSDSGVGADDEICTTDPCSDTWDGINNDASLSIASGKFVLTATDGTNSINLVLDDTAGNVFDGQSITEAWIEYKWEHDGAVLVASASDAIFQMGDSVDGDNAIRLDLKSDGAGVLDGINIRYTDDAGVQSGTEQAWSPTADTQYTLRVHWKKSSGSNDGVAEFSVVGGPSWSSSSVDNDEAGVVDLVRLGQITSLYGAATYIFKHDDFKIYTSDPGW